ncbi:MAG TPA: cation diffusion facilitator family transporter [Polyangiaceae bacterium]|nr:cation diffusion facilitator family transporter [Polyangiaceae bacterium]
MSASHDHDSHGHGHGHGHGSEKRAEPTPEPRRTSAEGGHGGHGHGGHGHGHGQSAKSALSIALVVTSAFMVVEVVVGFWSGSLALLADAGHMLADAGALVLAIVAQHFADKPRTDRTTFGFRRAEVLAAFVNGIALAFVGLLIVEEAVQRWITPVTIQGRPMLATAVGGLVVNLLVALMLMRGQSNLNVRAALAHVLTDALGSVGAILAALAVLLWGLTRADPLLSGLIAVLVVFSGWRVLRETTAILLEGAPPHLDVNAIERSIVTCPGVASVHDLHVWRISERFDTLTAHVTLERGRHGTDVCREVAEHLKREYGLDHVTIQPEPPPPDDVVLVRVSKDGAVIRQLG